MSSRYAVYLPDREIVRCITDVDDGSEEIPVDAFVARLLRSLERPDYGRCPSHVIVMHSALFHQLSVHSLLKAVLWTADSGASRPLISGMNRPPIPIFSATPI